VNLARVLRLSLAVAIMVAAGWAVRGYVTDDTFIHLRYAENLLHYGEFSFNPGQHTYGATSPLWIFGLALLLKLGLPPALAATVLGGLSGLLVLVLMDKIIDRLSFPGFWKTMLMVVVASDAWFLRWTWSGMETPLATAFLLMLMWPLVSGRDVGWGVTREPLWQRYLAWGVAAGMAGLVRPEFLLLGPLVLPLLLWFEYFRASDMGGASARFRARPYKPVLGAAAGWLLVVGPWLVYARFAFGRITPETAAAKSNAVSLAPTVVLVYLGQALKMLAATQGPLWMGVLAVVGLVWMRNRDTVRGGAWRFREEDRGSRPVAPGGGPWSVWGPVATVGITAVWTTALLGGYAVRQVWIISRYVCPLSPVLMLAMAVIIEWLLRGAAIDRRTLAAGRGLVGFFILATLVLNTWLFTTRVVPHAHRFSAGVRECYLDLGYWLKVNTPSDAVIAAVDIGALGYGSEREVLDLMGLVSPEILALGQEMGFAEMVESGAWLKTGAGRRRPDYFVDRAEGPPRWIGRVVSGVRFELLKTCTLEGVGLRESQPWTVALYRLVSTGTRIKSSAGG